MYFTEEIKNAQETLFDDVVEDFSQIEYVKEQFEKWKFTYGDSYREAYIGLCLPKLFTPLIRNELLMWNPLSVSNNFLVLISMYCLDCSERELFCVICLQLAICFCLLAA